MLFALLTAGACGLFASDGRVPLYASGTLAQPGSYYLTRDLTSAGTTLTISAANVTLDLAGHTVTSSAAGVSIIATADAASGLDIHGGRIVAGGVGVRVGVNGGARNIRLHDLYLSGQTAMAVEVGGPTTPTRNVMLERLEVADAKGAGLFCWNCDGALIRDNLLHTTIAGAGDGIALSAGGLGDRVTNNLIRGFGEGILLSAVTACVVTRNGVSKATSNGINVNGASRNLLRDNLVIDVASGGFGINVNNGNQNSVTGNSTMNDGGYGINISPGSANVYANNRSRGNGTNYFIAPGNVNGGGNF